MNEFSDKLKDYLKRNNMTMMDFARKVGVSATTVQDWCSEKRYPKEENRQKAYSVMGIRPEIKDENFHSVKGTYLESSMLRNTLPEHCRNGCRYFRNNNGLQICMYIDVEHKPRMKDGQKVKAVDCEIWREQ